MPITTTTLISRIPEIVADLPSTVKDALMESAEAIAEAAKERVPVDSGALRDAIHVEEIEGGASVVAGDERVFYGHLVEHGTTQAPPRPFLIPAFEAERENLLERVGEALEDI
jgi:HK97 gp10 family phage protein